LYRYIFKYIYLKSILIDFQLEKIFLIFLQMCKFMIYYLFFRCNPILSPYKKCLISYNWEYGKYNKSTIFRREMSMPWLQITDEMLWWCGGNYLYNIKRREQNKKRLYFYNYEFMNEDFTKFVLCNNFVISGHRCVFKYYLL